jgi:hypothetical protein
MFVNNKKLVTTGTFINALFFTITCHPIDASYYPSATAACPF